MHNRVTSHRGSSPPCTRHPIHACAPVCCVVVDFSSTVSVLYFVPPLSFQPFQMFSSVFNEKFRSNTLCDFRLGTVATSDHETPLTVDELKSFASGLNKIIQNSQFKRRISLEEQKAQKEDRFLRGRQIACLICEQFRVTGTDSSVENYADLFTIVLRNDDFQEFDSKWDGILLSMTKIPHDDILEGLYKLRIRESEKLKTVLELYDLESHQK